MTMSSFLAVVFVGTLPGFDVVVVVVLVVVVSTGWFFLIFLGGSVSIVEIVEVGPSNSLGEKNL